MNSKSIVSPTAQERLQQLRDRARLDQEQAKRDRWLQMLIAEDQADPSLDDASPQEERVFPSAWIACNMIDEGF